MSSPPALLREHARACQDLEARLALARAKAHERLEKRLETQRLEKQRQSSRNKKDARVRPAGKAVAGNWENGEMIRIQSHMH